MIMKLLTCSRGNPKRLFVPIHELECKSFVVPIRHISSRQAGTSRRCFLRGRRPRRFWAVASNGCGAVKGALMSLVDLR